MFLFGSIRRWCLAAYAAGIAFSIVSIASEIYFINLRMHSVVTTGTISAVDVKPDDDKNLYCPHFEFKTSDGRTYTGRCHIWEGRATPPFSVGDIVTVRYKPDAPGDAWLESWVSKLPRDTGISGLCGLIIGFVLQWFAQKRGVSLRPF